MRTLTMILTGIFFFTVGSTFAQSTVRKDSVQNQKGYQKKTYRKTTRLTYKDSIKSKENAPILNDNGTSSTTGTIEGRSSTGRPGSDTLVNYSVRRKKTTIRTVDGTQPESVKEKKKP